MRKKQIISTSLTTLLLLIVIIVPGQAASEIEIEGKSALLMEEETGQVIYTQNEDLQLPTASLTKIMTLLVAMEEVDNGQVSIDDEVVISQRAQSMGGSQIWLSAGDTILLKDLIKAVLVPSANDATVALAEHVGGTKENFVHLMNLKAEELGLEKTHFSNATGLPNDGGGHYSTAKEVAIMARELIANFPIMLEWGNTRVAYIEVNDEQKPIWNTNQLVGHFSGLDGLKTGWTDEAEYCLVGTAEQGGRRLISVVMGAKDEAGRQEETRKLLNYGFRVFNKVHLINEGTEIEETITVKNAAKPEVVVETATDFSAMVKRGTKDQIEQELSFSENLKAPLSKGEVVGTLTFVQNGNELGEIDLVTSRGVEEAGIIVRIFRWLRDFIISLF